MQSDTIINTENSIFLKKIMKYLNVINESDSSVNKIPTFNIMMQYLENSSHLWLREGSHEDLKTAIYDKLVEFSTTITSTNIYRERLFPKISSSKKNIKKMKIYKYGKLCPYMISYKC